MKIVNNLYRILGILLIISSCGIRNQKKNITKLQKEYFQKRINKFKEINIDNCEDAKEELKQIKKEFNDLKTKENETFIEKINQTIKKINNDSEYKIEIEENVINQKILKYKKAIKIINEEINKIKKNKKKKYLELNQILDRIKKNKENITKNKILEKELNEFSFLSFFKLDYFINLKLKRGFISNSSYAEKLNSDSEKLEQENKKLDKEHKKGYHKLGESKIKNEKLQLYIKNLQSINLKLQTFSENELNNNIEIEKCLSALDERIKEYKKQLVNEINNLLKDKIEKYIQKYFPSEINKNFDTKKEEKLNNHQIEELEKQINDKDDKAIYDDLKLNYKVEYKSQFDAMKNISIPIIRNIKEKDMPSIIGTFSGIAGTGKTYLLDNIVIYSKSLQKSKCIKIRYESLSPIKSLKKLVEVLKKLYEWKQSKSNQPPYKLIILDDFNFHSYKLPRYIESHMLLSKRDNNLFNEKEKYNTFFQTYVDDPTSSEIYELIALLISFCKENKINIVNSTNNKSKDYNEYMNKIHEILGETFKTTLLTDLLPKKNDHKGRFRNINKISTSYSIEFLNMLKNKLNNEQVIEKWIKTNPTSRTAQVNRIFKGYYEFFNASMISFNHDTYRNADLPEPDDLKEHINDLESDDFLSVDDKLKIFEFYKKKSLSLDSFIAKKYFDINEMKSSNYLNQHQITNYNKNIKTLAKPKIVIINKDVFNNKIKNEQIENEFKKAGKIKNCTNINDLTQHTYSLHESEENTIIINAEQFQDNLSIKQIKDIYDNGKNLVVITNEYTLDEAKLKFETMKKNQNDFKLLEMDEGGHDGVVDRLLNPIYIYKYK